MKIPRPFAHGGALIRVVYIYIYERFPTMKIGVERVNKERRLFKFAGYITLAGNQL